MLTYEDALQQLKNIVENNRIYTLTDLENLISKISVVDPIANSDATTVLYSGMVKGDVHSNTIIQKMYKQSDVRIIDRTQVGKFLLSREYNDAIKTAYKNTNPNTLPSELKGKIATYLYGGESKGTTGPWADASKRFAQNTKGNVYNITPNAGLERTWAMIEMPNILDNPNVTSINGKPKIWFQREWQKGMADLPANKSFFEMKWFDDLLENIRGHGKDIFKTGDSASDLAGAFSKELNSVTTHTTSWALDLEKTLGKKIDLSDYNISQKSYTKVLAKNGWTKADISFEKFYVSDKVLDKVKNIVKNENGSISIGWFDNISTKGSKKIAGAEFVKAYDQVSDTLEKTGYFKKFSNLSTSAKVLTVVGALADIIELGFVAKDAINASLDGDNAQAFEYLKDWGASSAGAWLLGSTSNIIVSTLLAGICTGPIGAAIGLTIGIGVGIGAAIIGSSWGEKIGDAVGEIYTNTVRKDTHGTSNGGYGDDVMYGDDRSNILNGGSGNDSLYGKGDNDILNGGAGNDRLYGGEGDDFYVFGRGYGIDRIIDNQGSNVIRFIGALRMPDLSVIYTATGDLVFKVRGSKDMLVVDSFCGYAGNRNLKLSFKDGTFIHVKDENSPLRNMIGDEEDNVLKAFYDMATRLIAHGGNDQLYGAGGNDTLEGGAGDDYLSGGAGNDYLDGGTGNDFLQGGEGDDTYIFGRGYGSDTIYDYHGLNTIRFVGGVNARDLAVVRTESGNMTIGIRGTTDYLTIRSHQGTESYRNFNLAFSDGTVMHMSDPRSPFNIYEGSNSNDRISAFYPNNAELRGYYGNDYLYGNKGNDLLDGGAGNDVLVGGDGDDTYIFGLGYGSDTITDYQGLNTIRFLGGIKPANLSVQYNNNTLYLTIRGTSDTLIIQYFKSNPSYRNFNLAFSDGSLMHISSPDSPLVTMLGDEQDNRLEAFYSTDALLVGYDGNDYLYGADGNDRLYGDAGHDTLRGGAGHDRLYGGEGDDRLYGDAGDDTLDGARGNDLLQGGEGNDTYIFGRGYGFDIIEDYQGINRIKFGQGISVADLELSDFNSNHLSIRLKGTSDQLVLSCFIVSSAYRNFELAFSDGTVFSVDALNSPFRQMFGSDRSDSMTAALANTVIHGLDGDDYLTGSVHDDQLYGDGGNDTLRGGAGHDRLYGGEGDDRLYGDAGDDTLDGARGNDLLQGGKGNDTYIFGRGYGFDVIEDYQGINRIKFGQGISVADLELSDFNLSHLSIQLKGTSDQLVLSYFIVSSAYRNFELAFSDGTVFSVDAPNSPFRQMFGSDRSDSMTAALTNTVIHGLDGSDTITGSVHDDQLYGDAGNDTLIGGAGHDRLYGGEGDDRLYGDAGDDTLDGGRGNDLLQGGEGNDTYIFNRGYGFDRVEDYQGINTIRFLDGIKSTDLSVQYNNNSLYLTIRGTTDTLIIEHFKSNPSYRNFNLVFTDEKAVDVKDFVKEKTSVSSIRQMVKSFSDYQLDSQPVMGAIDASIAQQTDQIIQAMASFDTKGNVASLGKSEIMDDSLVYRSSMVQNWVNSVSS